MGQAALARQQQQAGTPSLAMPALFVSQHPGLSSCWLAAGGAAAFRALQDIAPVLAFPAGAVC